jgi:hypothetical protein
MNADEIEFLITLLEQLSFLSTGKGQSASPAFLNRLIELGVDLVEIHTRKLEREPA